LRDFGLEDLQCVQGGRTKGAERAEPEFLHSYAEGICGPSVHIAENITGCGGYAVDRTVEIWAGRARREFGDAMWGRSAFHECRDVGYQAGAPILIAVKDIDAFETVVIEAVEMWKTAECVERFWVRGFSMCAGGADKGRGTGSAGGFTQLRRGNLRALCAYRGKYNGMCRLRCGSVC
jgi:hypothetical protein